MPSATILPLPANTSERNERELAKLWAEQDRLEQALRDVRERIRPVQRQVSLDRGYLFTVSREALERPTPERKRK